MSESGDSSGPDPMELDEESEDEMYSSDSEEEIETYDENWTTEPPIINEKFDFDDEMSRNNMRPESALTAFLSFISIRIIQKYINISFSSIFLGL
uniref:Uncharacterized protein n=1 Tax=Acrobeloides nanus TaxID=290746 RepID=A0A914EIW4_9BILA